MNTNMKQRDINTATTSSQKQKLQEWKRVYKYGHAWIPRGSFEEFLRKEMMINMKDGTYLKYIESLRSSQPEPAKPIIIKTITEGTEMAKKTPVDESNHAEKLSKKKVKLDDLKALIGKTATQKKVISEWKQFPKKNLFMSGTAGTGKTFLAMRLAIEAVLDPSTSYDKLIIVRSVVPSREIGYLPGSIDEKISAYEDPYVLICEELFKDGKRVYETLKDQGLIEFMPTSYLRGTTLNRAVVVVDEIQNMNFGELDTVITRIGEQSKVVFCGDYRQNDLYGKRGEESGFDAFFDIINSMKGRDKEGGWFAMHEFDHNDIVRSGLVKDYITQKEIIFGDPRYDNRRG